MKLPEGIDYSKYYGKGGANTRAWGPKAWDYLFTSIMGRYPVKIDYGSPEDIQVLNAFSHMLIGLKDTLPCVFCRKSFEVFVKELPIEEFLKGRIQLMYWLYLLKIKVNSKLKKQEKICYNDEKKRLKGLFHHGDITKDQYYTSLQKSKEETFLTQPTPPFKEVLDKYESYRAVCSKKALKCI